MPDPVTTTAFTTAATLIVTLAGKLYEINAVDQEARDLLETTAHINTQVEYAKKLRRQKSEILSRDEKEMIDKVVSTTEDAVHIVSSLIEPARVDMEVLNGQVRLSTRMRFVFCDLARVPISLSKLGIAGSNLNMAITVLASKDGSRESLRPRTPCQHGPTSPPTYQESEWLYSSWQKNLRKRANAAVTNRTSLPSWTETNLPPASIAGHSYALPFDVSLKETAEPVELADNSIAVRDGSGVDVFNNTERASGNESCYGMSDLPIVVTPQQEEAGPLVGRARSRSWMDYHMQKC